MTYTLSARSMNHLAEVHSDLRKLFKEAIRTSPVDFAVIDGLRTKAEQRALFAKGASQTMKSRHLTGHAVDVVPYIDGSVTWEWKHYYPLAKHIKATAAQLGISIEWGGDWRSFKDGPHWQLPWDKYGANDMEPHHSFADEFIPKPDTSKPSLEVTMDGAEYLTIGSNGYAVIEMLTRMQRQGYWNGSIIEDYNYLVEGAVKNMQADLGMTGKDVDGIYGPKSRDALTRKSRQSRIIRDQVMAERVVPDSVDELIEEAGAESWFNSKTIWTNATEWLSVNALLVMAWLNDADPVVLLAICFLLGVVTIAVVYTISSRKRKADAAKLAKTELHAAQMLPQRRF